MKFKNKKPKRNIINNFSLLIFCLFIFLVKCKTSNEMGVGFSDSDVIYFNSFESVNDTFGIEGFGNYVLSVSASPGGGKKSLYVSGGCFVPHVILPIPVQIENGYYQLKCWGKVEIGDGVVVLSTDSSSESNYITISILNENWKYDLTSDSLYCPANTAMKISIISGGKKPGGILIDQIEIVKTD